MPELEQTPVVSPVQRYWWGKAWVGARPRFIASAKEIILSVQLLLALAIFYLFSRLLIFVGVPVESVKILERVDFWLIFAVIVTFGLFFLLELIIGFRNQITRSLKSATEKNE